MIYSRVLQVEHEQPKNEYGEGAYTIFNLVQPFTLNLKKSKSVWIQSLAVLWNNQIDTRIIAMIETALIEGALSPVLLLQATKGTLNIVHSSHTSHKTQDYFENTWHEIAGNAWYDEWSANFICDSQIIFNDSGGRIFRTYAEKILSDHKLGMRLFTTDMFLHHEEWEPEKLLGPSEYQPRGTENDDQVPDAFDDNISF
ncbi:hypothetical protein QCL51_07145 [Pseudomonas sp. LTR0]|uniref:hypothetical protein n=1 Tax=Pseudomonas sp. LTR0 TaxID=3040601 RepID=UPI0030CBD30E